MNIIDAVEKNDIDALKRLVEAGADVNETDGKWSALMLAAANRNLRAVRYLLSKGADTEIRFGGSAPHLTTLGWAAGYGFADIVQVLIEHGANVNVKEKDGTTLLMIILIKETTPEVVKLLLENGADANVTFKGVTALIIAKHQGLDEIANVIRNYDTGQFKDPDLSTMWSLFLKHDYDTCVNSGLELIATKSVSNELLQLTLISLFRCKSRGPWKTPHFKSNGSNAFIAKSFVAVAEKTKLSNKWNRLLLRLTTGDIEFSKVLSQADDIVKKCQAYYYYGARLVSVGRKRDALNEFKAAIDQNATCLENIFAEGELKSCLADLK